MTKKEMPDMQANPSKKISLLRSLYAKILAHAHTPQAFWLYIAIAFSESSFFLIPPDVMLIPMGVSNRALVWRLAFWGTVASVVGGLFGYAIGAFFIDSLGQWIINTYHLQSGMDTFTANYKEWGFWIIVIKGLTPVPYKIVTIASGIAHFPIIPFIIASIIARGFRFYLVAALVWKFGAEAKALLDRYLGLCLIASICIVVGGFILLKIFL